MAGSTIRTGGFGFAFPQNSPLLSNLSGEILRIREGKQMDDIENKYFGHETCLNPSNNITSNALDINDFRAIFITMAAASGLAMFSYFCSNLYASPKVEGNREIEPNAQGNREIQPNAEGNREIQLSRVLQP
ncbi:PREDICTED: glutamate receptor 2.5-like [Nelumbo nucifera]|nr:PREDICTED: glutamate receptor 2.5-like [Nelumbo nucifera]